MNSEIHAACSLHHFAGSNMSSHGSDLIIAHRHWLTKTTTRDFCAKWPAKVNHSISVCCEVAQSGIIYFYNLPTVSRIS